MPRESRALRDDVRAEVLTEIEAAAAGLPATDLIPLLTFVVECRDRRRVSALRIRRALGRWRALRRFAEVKRETGLSDRQVIGQIVRESARGGAGAKLKERTMQRWIKTWNTPVDGLAAGPAGLVGHYARSGRSKKHRDSDGV